MLTPTQNRRKRTTKPSDQSLPGEWLRAGHYDPDFQAAIEAELRELAQLRPNWDGYGAPAINPAVIHAACEFVRSLPENLVYRPHVVPTASGDIQLEWHHDTKVLEFEFENVRTIHFLQWHPEAGEEEESTFGVEDVDRAVDLISWFMSGTCV